MSRSSPIAAVKARQVLDSRGRPTVEADVILEDGVIGRACAPSGASTGRYEAWELRDGDQDQYEGRGVLTAVGHARSEIDGLLRGRDVLDQQGIDAAMCALDGTDNLKRLGANAILAVSLAACRAAALTKGQALYRYIAELAGTQPSMPMPMTNILSGGAHAGCSMDVQDFLMIPVGAESYEAALHMISRVRSSAAALMAKRGLTTLLADEGGLSPGFASASEGLDLMVEAFEAAGLRPGVDAAIALDVAASELFDGANYRLTRANRTLSGPQMADEIAGFVARYPIVSVEDALDQDDWENWIRFTAQAGHIQLVGDDFFATNPGRIREGIQRGAANAALIKLNQNGTLSGTLEAIRIARDAGYNTVVSARSGETEDAFIADLAVGSGAGQIKIGSVRSSERMAKYNQLLRIEEDGLPFAPWQARRAGVAA